MHTSLALANKSDKYIIVFNLSSRTLNVSEMTVSPIGLKFAPTPKNKHIQEMRTKRRNENKYI